MDTLCIPVHPSAKPYRKRAIQLLGKTFHEARAVLVLDRELEIVNPTTSSFLELGIHILSSGWMKRLWTLQEATFASDALGEDRIFLQMRDYPFPYQKYDRNRLARTARDGSTMLDIHAQERSVLDEIGIILLLAEQIPSVRAVRSDVVGGWSPLYSIALAIEHRTTSKAEDVPLCVTSLLGKDVAPILAADDLEGRMANFYVLVREIPLGILWARATGLKKLTAAPFRWAPCSLAHCPHTAFMGWPIVVCDTSGLHVRYPGFILKLDVGQLGHAGLPLPRVFVLVSADCGDVFGRFSWSSITAEKVTDELRRGSTLAIMTAPAIGLPEAPGSRDPDGSRRGRSSGACD